jgi:hypothetical protein
MPTSNARTITIARSQRAHTRYTESPRELRRPSHRTPPMNASNDAPHNMACGDDIGQQRRNESVR